MKEFRIAYIDEAEADIRSFQRFNHTKGQYFQEIIPVKPVPDLQELISIILDTRCDAIVVDFRLSEEAPEIKYDGGDVIKAFLEERPGFPVFILSSYGGDAIEQGPDVNIVNEKNMIYLGEDKLLKKIEEQIKKYKKNIDNAEKELLTLIKSKGERSLSAHEEEEFIRLDSFLQKSLSGKFKIPDSSKEPSNSKKLSELLKKADAILNRLEPKK